VTTLIINTTKTACNNILANQKIKHNTFPNMIGGKNKQAGQHTASANWFKIAEIIIPDKSM
jgi:hypothetical protein